MIRVLSKKDEQFIRDNYIELTTREIGEKLGGISKGTVQSFMKREGLRVPLDKIIEKRTRSVKKAYAEEVLPEDKILKRKYLEVNVKQLSILVNRSEMFVTTRLRGLGLVIPPELIEQRKQESRLKPGNIPYTKGKKQNEYMSPEAIERTKATRFYTGQLPHNTKGGVGTITIRKDKLKDGSIRKYKWICIELAVWKMLHVKIWEDAHGPVPSGHIIIFKDKDSMNVVLENLAMITLEDNMRRNSIHRFPTELKTVIRIAAKIKKTIKKLSDEKKQSHK